MRWFYSKLKSFRLSFFKRRRHAYPSRGVKGKQFGHEASTNSRFTFSFSLFFHWSLLCQTLIGRREPFCLFFWMFESSSTILFLMRNIILGKALHGGDLYENHSICMKISVSIVQLRRVKSRYLEAHNVDPNYPDIRASK